VARTEALIAAAILLASGCAPSAAKREGAPPSERVSEVLLDGDILAVGQVANTRDLNQRADELEWRLQTGSPSDPKRPRMIATARLIESAIKANPQCLRFRLQGAGGAVSLEPVDTLPSATGPESRFDVVVIGGEVESIVLATALAERSVSVCLVVAGPLGGLCSDSGGNLRFFDGYWDTPRPPLQKRLFSSALGMRGFVCLPTDMDARIAAYLSENFPKLRVERIKSYEELFVELDAQSLKHIVLPSGETLKAACFVDSDPEARVAEKSGLAYSTLTPNLPYGMVFDVTGISKPDLLSPSIRERTTPEAIQRFAGGDAATPLAKKSLDKLTKDAQSDFAHDRGAYLLGFKALAEGFNLYMQIRASDGTETSLFNRARRMSGFNVAFNGSVANFNSISYALPFTLLQHAHDLHSDSRLREDVAAEADGLQTYLRYALNLPDLQVRIPSQFYVRKSTARFTTKHPYVRRDFGSKSSVSGGAWMSYPMDYRSILPRNSREREQFNRLFWSSERVFWECRPNVCETTIGNLYLLNKCMLTPEFSGATRILQNFVTTGVQLADVIASRIEGR
jgi:hypothetical protein